jgi:hypothetical protein
VCELIATGHNLRQIEEMRATEPELPARRTIHDWVKTRPDFERAYYIALEMRAAARADEMIEIARDVTIPDVLANRQINALKHLATAFAQKRSSFRSSPAWVFAQSSPNSSGCSGITAAGGRFGWPNFSSGVLNRRSLGTRLRWLVQHRTRFGLSGRRRGGRS